MLYRYDKRMRRVSRILDTIHDKGYPDNEFSVAVGIKNDADVMIGTANDLIKKAIEEHGLPKGWTAEEKEGTYYKFSCIGEAYGELSDMLDGFYYWAEESLPAYEKD